MKNKFLKWYDKLIMVFLSLFPFYSGCDEPREMYGTPTADYVVKGTVSDASNDLAIRDIRVILSRNRDELYNWNDTTYTDARGKYAFNFTDFPKDDATFGLKVEDIDGESNGGHFTTKETEVTIGPSNWDRSNAGDWYSGIATLLKDFKLDK